MGLLDRATATLFSLATWRKSAFDLVPIGVAGRPQYPDTDLASLQRAYLRNEMVYAAINIKATVAGAARLRVRTRSGPAAEWTEQPGHPLRRLLMRPNPQMDEAAFRRAVQVSLDTTGRFYAEIQRSAARLPVALHPLNPAKVAEIPGPDGAVRGYEFRDGGRTTQLPVEDVLARRYWHPTNPYQGLAPLQVALGSVDADTAQTDFVREFFNNAGVPSGLLKIKGRKLSQGQADEVRNQWRMKYGRQWGRLHDVAVMDEDAEYQKIGTNLGELSSDSIRAQTETRIAMVFGVPPLIIYAYSGLLRATYSNLGDAWQNFWDATIAPLLADEESWLLWHLLPEFVDEELIYSERIGLQWDTTNVFALRLALLAQAETARKNFQAGLITLDEGRAAIGEQPDGAGAYYLRPLTMVAVPAGKLPAPPSTPLLGSGGKALPPDLALKVLRSVTTGPIEAEVARAVAGYLADQYRAAAAAVRESA